jgi:hypothetical protein
MMFYSSILSYVSLILVLLAFFEIVYGIGRILEQPLLNFYPNQ